MKPIYFRPFIGVNYSSPNWIGLTGSQEFLKMMTHKILNRDPKDEILKALGTLKFEILNTFGDRKSTGYSPEN